ncbi:hypothetical protein AMQ83_31325, partial [Paenibacillus riograndensis]
TSGATLKKEIFFYERDKKVWKLFVDSMHVKQYGGLGRNDACGCGSGKKFKYCCFEIYEGVKRLWRSIEDQNLAVKIMPHPSVQVEESIFSF